MTPGVSKPTATIGRIIIGLIFAVGFLLIFRWLAEEVFEGETNAFDETVRNFVHRYASAPLTELMKFLSFLGSPLFLVILGALLAGVLLYLKHKRAFILLLVTMAGEIVLDLSLKHFFGRERPAAFFDYSLPSSYGFPSGMLWVRSAFTAFWRGSRRSACQTQRRDLRSAFRLQC